MRQSKKLLSVLLAVVMVFSTVAIAASAYAPWRDEAIANQYNGMDKPVLTINQYASAALDEVDRMLNEEQIMLTKDDIFVGDLDVTSVDSTLDGVQTIINGNLWTQFSPMLGDLVNLDVSRIATPRRSAGTADADLQVLYALLGFLYDNKGIFTGLIDGTINLGSLVGPLLEGLLDGGLDVTALVKDMLYELAYGKDAPDSYTETVDDMAQYLIDKYVVTGYTEDDGTVVEGLLPALAGYTNISNGSTYDFVDNALKIAYNELIVPMANEKWILDIDELLVEEADALEGYKKFFNLTAEGKCNFTFQRYEFTDSMTFMGELNNILASIINIVITDEIGFEWSTGANSQIVPNIIKFGKEVLAQTGDTFFASFVDVKTPEELDAMTDMEVCAYVARAIINSSVDGVWVPESADNLVKVTNYTVKGIVAVDLPGRDYSDTALYPNDSMETIYAILADYAAEALNDLFDLGIEYGTSLDDVATAIANWGIENYGGLLSGINLSTSNSGWQNLDNLVFSIINKNWIDASLFENGNVNLEELLKKVILENILNLNFDGLISIISTEVPGSELQNSFKQVLLNFLPRLLNIVFPNLLATNMTKLEDIISKTNLSNTVNALFTDLWTYRVSLLSAVLPLVCSLLDLTNAQEFDSPEFTIKPFYYVSGGVASFNFTITNPSAGVNTGYTDANGNFHQDSRYAIKINSVSTSLNTLSVTQPNESQKVLDGGESLNIYVQGNFSSGVSVIFTINYDVLVEDGTKLTSTPLEARIYSFFSTTDTDETKTASVSNTAASIVDGYVNVFGTSIGALDDLELRVKNNADVSSGTSITAYPYAATSTTTSMGKLSFLNLVTEGTSIPAGTQANVKIFEFAEGWDETEEKRLAAEEEAFTTKGYKRYYQNTGVTVNGTDIYTTQVGVTLFKDYGLPALFNSEVSAQRQASDYTDSAAWSAYLTAMDEANAFVNANKAVMRFAGNSGNARYYEERAAALEAAVEALEASVATGGATSTLELLETIQPPNEEGAVYDDAGYNFFDKDDYMAYTYENYADARSDAWGLVNGSKVYETSVDETTGEIITNWDVFTYGAVDALSVAYTNHRLSLYANRLRPLAGLKTNLNIAVNNANAAGYVQDDYTEDSWSAYARAIAFATSVNNEAGAKQSKINVAYEELIEAQKRLMAVDGEGGGDVDVPSVEIAPSNPGNSSYQLEVIENTAGDKLLLGVFPEAEVADINSYFTVSGGATVSYDKIATGGVVTITGADGAVVDTYTLVITADVNGDGEVGVGDYTVYNKVLANLSSFSDTGDSAYDMAADLNNSGDADVSDYTIISKVVAQLGSIDFAARASAQ